MNNLIGTNSRSKSEWWLVISLFFFGIVFAITIATVTPGQPLWLWISRFAQNIIAALAGAILTLVLIDRMMRRTIVSDAVEITEDLVLRLRGETGDAADAADMLRQTGKFRDGSLRGKNLTGAQLDAQNLSKADFTGTKLRAASLRNANLRNAVLENADLSLADLHCARLRGADLTGANLWLAYLHGADLRDARLNEEALESAFSLRGAIMPDGSRYSGRFALPGDLEAAAAGIDTSDEHALKRWYASLNPQQLAEA